MGYILTTGTEPDILETIRFVALVRGSHEVIVAQSALEILQRARRDRPSLAVWDLGFNDRRENQHLSQWYADRSLLPVPLVLLTAAGVTNRHTLPSPLPDGTTCLVKPIDPVELGLRVGALLDPENGRVAPCTGDRRQVGDLVLDYQLFEVSAGDRTVSLTPTEFKLLRHLMENAGQTFSSEQLLDEVWKYPPDVGSVDVVRMYVKRLRDKIEPDPREPRYIVTIPGHGYRLPMPETSNQSAEGQSPIPQRNGTTSRHPELTTPLLAIDGTFQEILKALQTVTLTCQATLATMVHLMDALSGNGNGRQHIGPATASRQPFTSAEVSTGNGTREKVRSNQGRRAQDIASPISYLLDQPNPAPNDIAIAAQSLRGLVAELQSTLTHLEVGWPCTDPKPVSVVECGAACDCFNESSPHGSGD